MPVKSFIIQLSTPNKRKELPVTDCTQRSFNFPAVKKRVVEVNFEGGDITSDGGVMLLRQADRLIGL
ncbi:MAG: transposase, partial [Nitrosomonas sp.]|nr:transposase [Nitrosomonas sp.]